MEGICAQLSSPCLTLICLVLDRSCAFYNNYYEFICAAIMLCSEDTFDLESSVISGSYGFSVPFSAVISEPLEKGHSIYVSYKAEHSIGSDFFYTLDNCALLC